MSARTIVEGVTDWTWNTTSNYRVEGDKYWVAPDGELISVDDHSDWAMEAFDLPNDEGDGEKAGENISAAQEQGYVDIHTEREANTQNQFVFVRMPWSGLKKAQRESIKKLADGLAALVLDDGGRRPVEVYDARGMRRD